MTQFLVSRRIRLFLALFGLALVAAFATTALGRTAGPVSADSPNVEITFTKWAVTPAPNVGVVDGDVVGTLEWTASKTVLPNVEKIHATYVVTGVTDSGPQTFTAVLDGKANLQTAERVLNGIITEGWLAGAQVHVEFLRLATCPENPAGPCFTGTLRIMAASAD
jgi:hypothetical protein